MTQNQINYARLREEARHNRATEGYTGIELAETQRHNVVSENTNWYSANEQGRHNQASEGIDWYTAVRQGETYVTQAARNMAEANLATTKAEQISRDYELEKDKFEHQVWKDVKSIGIDLDQLELNQSDRAKAWEYVDAQIADIFYNQGLDFEKYKTDYVRARGSVFRDVASGAKSIIDGALELFDWGWGMINGIMPTK